MGARAHAARGLRDEDAAVGGQDPAEVRVEGPQKGLRVLGDREDSARALLTALDDSQRTTATIEAVAPNDIITKTAATVDEFSMR